MKYNSVHTHYTNFQMFLLYNFISSGCYNIRYIIKHLVVNFIRKEITQIVSIIFLMFLISRFIYTIDTQVYNMILLKTLEMQRFAEIFETTYIINKGS